MTSSRGKLIEIKREGDEEVARVYKEDRDLRPFKERPQENLEEASKRKYEVVGTEMSTEYEDMGTSKEEKQVQSLSKIEQLQHCEMKDMMTVQGRLKGQIPGFKEGIQMQITGQFPGVPSTEVKKYAVPEEGKRADLHLPPPVVEELVERHDSRIPMRLVNPTPGQRGIVIFIDPQLDQDELFEEDLEGNLVQRMTLEATKTQEVENKRKRRNEENEEETKQVQKQETTIEQGTEKEQETAPSTSKTPVFIPTDILTEQIASGYLPDDDSDGETISSTSTVDYDRDEAEDLVDKIASCHSTLSTHYLKLCSLVPHMSKTQLGLYLGKIPFTPLIKAEPGTVKRDVPWEAIKEEEFNPEINLDETPEEKLQSITTQLTAQRVMFMVALGDYVINKHSQRYISKKYGITLSSVQRMISGNPEHKKGGRQYESEKKKRGHKTTTEEEETEGEPEKKKSKKKEKIPGASTIVKMPESMEQIQDDDDDLKLPDVNF